MPDTPSSRPDRPEFPTPREIEVLYPGLAQGAQLLQEAGKVYIAKTLEGKKMDQDALIQVYLNYCKNIEKYPAYVEQARLAFDFIDNNAANIDINDNDHTLHERYPFLGPLVTVIRNR